MLQTNQTSSASFNHYFPAQKRPIIFIYEGKCFKICSGAFVICISVNFNCPLLWKTNKQTNKSETVKSQFVTYSPTHGNDYRRWTLESEEQCPTSTQILQVQSHNWCGKEAAAEEQNSFRSPSHSLPLPCHQTHFFLDDLNSTFFIPHKTSFLSPLISVSTAFQ